MHLIKDENGNVVSHGHGEHGCPHSHDPDHEHCGHHHDGEGACGDCKNETVALLAYMVQHNEHHAAELDQMADKNGSAGCSQDHPGRGGGFPESEYAF